MMRIAATVVILAVLASITWHMTKSPAYFVCDGMMTINGTDEQKPVRRASLTVEVAPALVRLLLRPERLGSVALFADLHHLFDLRRINDTDIWFGHQHGLGMFNRVSRHLRANTGEAEYDLSCRETTLAKL